MTGDRRDPAAPVLAICGHSGSGKTTLIERLVPELRASGWRVAVMKRTRHSVFIDVPGKDSDRFFRAGASVILEATGEMFTRVAMPPSDRDTWQRALGQLAASHDFVLVEGHKETPLPKVWLLGPGEAAPPLEIDNLVATLGRDEDRLRPVRTLCHQLATAALARRRLLGALVLDRAGDRASATHALATLARCVEQVVIVGGDQEWPSIARLPPVLGVEPSSLAHTLTALRWAPDAAWLVVRPGPGLAAEVLTALIAQRRPGRCSLAAPDGVDAILYEPGAREALEATAG